jgi:hypothetical protein
MVLMVQSQAKNTFALYGGWSVEVMAICEDVIKMLNTVEFIDE